MKIELKIGELRMTADDHAVRLHGGEFALTAEEAEIAGRMLAALGESLRMQARRGADAELATAFVGSTAHGGNGASPQPTKTAAVARVLADPKDAAAALPLGDRSAPRFAVRTPSAAQSQTEKPQVGNGGPIRLPSRAQGPEARPAVEAPGGAVAAPQAPRDAASPAHGRRILSPSAQANAKTEPAPAPKQADGALSAAASGAEQADPTAAAAEPAAAPQRRILRPAAATAQEPVATPTEGTAPARRVLRPATTPGVEGAAVPAEVPAASRDAAPRRILRPTAEAATGASDQTPPPHSDPAVRRIARPTAPATAATAPAPALAAEGQARRVARPSTPIEASPAEAATSPAEPRRPGRPRKTPLAAPTEAVGAAAASIAPAPKQRAKAAPGRPRTQAGADLGNAAPRRGPGRPRKVPQVAAPAAEAARAAPQEPAGESAESPVGEPKGRTPRLVDRLDQWMRDNPGPKTREQLLDVSIANGWVTGPDPSRIFSMCMNRERNLFTRMPDGNTEIYLRRAELVPPKTPGKVIRRQGTSKPAS